MQSTDCVEVRDVQVKLLRFAAPAPAGKVGLAWRHTSPRKVDFLALGQLVSDTLGFATAESACMPPALPKEKRAGTHYLD